MIKSAGIRNHFDSMNIAASAALHARLFVFRQHAGRVSP